MYLPQFVLKLRLVNATTETRTRRSTKFLSMINYEDEYKSWVYLDQEIRRIPNEMIVIVVVDDINDNAPTFDFHDDLIGYPKKSLVRHIMPPYLTTVHVSRLNKFGCREEPLSDFGMSYLGYRSGRRFKC